MIQILPVVLFLVDVAASADGAPPPAARPSRDLVLSNGQVELVLTVREGRLEGDRLRAVRPEGSAAPALETDAGFSAELFWTDWRAPGRANNADNAVALGKDDFRVSGVSERDAGGGAREAVVTMEGPEGLVAEAAWKLPATGSWVLRRLRLVDRKGKGHFVVSTRPVDAVVRGGGALLNRGGFGQPVAIRWSDGTGAFFGVEDPAGTNTLAPAGAERVRCSADAGERLGAEGVVSPWAVVGLSPDGRVKGAFLDYVSTLRAGRLRPYTLWNSWYDLRSAEYPKITPARVMNQENVLAIARTLRREMTEKRGIRLDAFVLDDGWDVYRSAWRLRPLQFPNGLAPIEAELAKSGTRLGLWFGPTGGYSLRRQRVGWARENGFEVTGDQLCVAGPKYAAVLAERTAEMARAGVGYFKWDGLQLSCSEPSHGHPVGPASRRAALATVFDLASRVRAIDPDMFLNITSGTWLSPWWLRAADQVWMDGEDYGEEDPDVPSISTRDASITYRDRVLHEDFAKKGLWFPLANLMTHGVLKGAIDVAEIGKGEPLGKFADEVVFYLARGVSMHELYVSPDLLSEGEWTVLAESLRWARDRFEILSARAEMVGGDPGRLEPYGFVHWKGRRGIVAARNPSVKATRLVVRLDPEDGLDPLARDLQVTRVYPDRALLPGRVAAGGELTIPLEGFEAAVYEIGPAAPHVAASSSSAPSAPGDLGDGRVDSRPGGGVKAAFRVGSLSRDASIALLVRPRSPGRKDEPLGSVTALLDGRPVEMARVAARGSWAWYTARAAPGPHLLEAVVAGPGGAPFAGTVEAWLSGGVVPASRRAASGAAGSAGLASPLPPTGRAAGETPRSVFLGRLSMD